MEVYRGVGGVVSHILNLDEGDWTRETGSCTPTRTILYRRDDKIFSSRGESNLEYPVYSIISVFTEL